MKVFCAWCLAEGKPALLRLAEPFEDGTETHGICSDHQRELLAAADTWARLSRAADVAT